MKFEADRELADNLAGQMEALAKIYGEGYGRIENSQKLAEKAQQIREDRFRVLVVGEFKRGKSTLLNAMLGTDALPQKVTECTAIITKIGYGDAPGVDVHFADRRVETISIAEFRKQYELNVEDSAMREEATERFAHVDHAMVRYPVDVCRHGVELVDSPGLGAHRTRTQRTRKFLPLADAVVFVLNAKQFLSEDELHFLETTLLPMGLRNVFFVVNGWNLISESVIRPEQAAKEYADLESVIQLRLAPFCLIDGVDRSAERIFRVNALGALKARIQSPVDEAMAAASNIPQFEAALQRFLIEDRAKARADVVRGSLHTLRDETDRFIDAQLALADKSLADIEAERKGLEPVLNRLRGIRDNILNFLEGQSSVLQDRLITSLHAHLRKVEADLPAEVEKFDLTPITNKWLVWEGMKDWGRSNDQKFRAQVVRCIEPQVQKMLERRLAGWQQSVVVNEMKAVMIDVEKHLLEEAAEYQRVMGEIEAKIGFHCEPLQIQEQVRRWLGREQAKQSGSFDLPAFNTISETIGWLVAGIIGELIAELVLHVATGGITLMVTGVFSLLRLGMREATLRKQLQTAIIDGIGTGLKDIGLKFGAEIRKNIRSGFEGLKAKIGGSIAEEIAVIDASLAAIIEKKQQATFSADAERERFEAARRRATACEKAIDELLQGQLRESVQKLPEVVVPESPAIALPA
jgi:hypothetical protein